ncbi:MAG TPA: ROK family protein [Candidatus Saccharimonadales bacterium]|nr:ROK family protein [Candidatus Saccharimonadales bacterium]
MYLAIDIGGTKTLVASLTDAGVIEERHKFETPKDYANFKTVLADSVAHLSTKSFVACGVGFPGKIDQTAGVGLETGNLPWHHVSIRDDVADTVHCPVVVNNDAKLGGLSEAMLLKTSFSRVLYVTISTGIGIGLITKQHIDEGLADAEGGQMPLEHKGKLEKWESFASGAAIVRRFGKQAHDINDEDTWRIIARDIAVGLVDLIAVIQPEVIVLGGSVGAYYDRFKAPLEAILQDYSTPLVPIPPIKKAERPEEAVIYGCYDLARETYGNAH